MADHSQMCRIAIFYDGTYFSKVSNYYLFQHERGARIAIEGLHEFIKAEVGREENVDVRRCQIIDAGYFRGRLVAQDAKEMDRLYSDRVFEDVLMRANVTLYQQHVYRNYQNEFEEKRIDVWMALEAYEMTSLKKYDVCVMITGDGDFVPLVRKLNTLGARVMLVGFDFEYEQDGRKSVTRVSTPLLEAVNYSVMASREIDSRERSKDQIVNNMFMPRAAPRAPRVEIAAAAAAAAAAQGDGEKGFVGTVLNLVKEKRFGFIRPAAGGENIFFHANNLIDPDLFEGMMVGVNVRYLIQIGDKGPVANKVEPL